MSGTRRVAKGIVIACAAAAAALPAAAQQAGTVVLRGRVVDAQTMAPVAGAFVAPAGSKLGVLTDSLGLFAMSVNRAESYPVRVAQLGYRTLEAHLGGQAATTPVMLLLQPNPIEIEGLTVLTERFTDRRRGPFGVVDILDQEKLLASPHGTTYELVRANLPFAQPCSNNFEDEVLCLRTQGRADTLRVCVDEHVVLGGWQELETLDPRGLYMIEVFRRVGQVRIYTRGFAQRLLDGDVELMPMSFGCGAPMEPPTG